MKVLVDRSGLIWGSFESRIYVRSLSAELAKLATDMTVEFVEPSRPACLHARRIARMLKSGEFALFHSLGPMVPADFEGPTLMSIADMSPLIYPKEADRSGRTFRKYVSAGARFAKRVIAPSPFVRREFLRMFRFPSRWVDVVVPGEWPPVSGSTQARTEREQAENVALCVCESKPYKNWRRLIGAFEAARGKATDGWRLVMAFVDSIPKELARSARPAWLEVKLARSADAISRLYNEAEVFLYPSLYDGFPYLLVSAMKRGIASVASKTSSTKELIKSGAVLIDARNAYDLQKWIGRLLSSESMRRELSDAAVVEASRFSWPMCALATYDIYRKIAGVGWP